MYEKNELTIRSFRSPIDEGIEIQIKNKNKLIYRGQMSHVNYSLAIQGQDNAPITNITPDKKGPTIADKLKSLRIVAWNEDIPSPSCPEYIEHHESIKRILNSIDKLIEEENK